MGGCRCFFRDCRVSTYRNPRIHFFHIPLKDERKTLWVKYAKLESMSHYPISKQKNIVICARHFRDECFMNYKKDRLTAKAVPTLNRLSRDKALDYELDIEKGVLVTITEPSQKHLIPPPEFECALNLDNDEYLWELLRDLEKRDVGEGTEEAEFEMEIEEESNTILELEDLVEADSSNTTQRREEIIDLDTVQQSLLKRANTTLGDEEKEDNASVCHMSKRVKTLNHCQRQTTTLDAKHISLPQETTIQLDNFESKTPKIINHQIIEPDGNLWIEQESYNIADDGAEYELIEIPSSEEQLEPSTNIETSATQLDEDDPADEQCTSTLCQVNYLQVENANSELMEEKQNLEQNLLSCQRDNIRNEELITKLNSEIVSLKNDNELLKKQLKQTAWSSDDMEIRIRERYELQLQAGQAEHNLALQQISTLQHNLDLLKQQLSESKTNLIAIKNDFSNIQEEKIDLLKQQIETDHKLQILQEKYDNIDMEHHLLEINHATLQKSHKKLKEDYAKLESQQNQVSTVTTSNNSSLKTDSYPSSFAKQPTSAVAASTLTKAQLFNGIKRYISASMLALLRMEMFGSSDREWKSDERQVSVDLLRLGETVYKYFTDEWRLRLPGLRDVRIWLSQAVDMDDEEDL